MVFLVLLCARFRLVSNGSYRCIGIKLGTVLCFCSFHNISFSILHELKVYIPAKPADLFKEKAPRKGLVPEQRQDLLLARLNYCWCLFRLLLVLLYLGLCGCHGTGSGAKLSADVKLLNEFVLAEELSFPVFS